MHDTMRTRRRLLQYALLGAAGYALGHTSHSRADALLPVASNDVTAKGLDYHANAASVDNTDYPEYDASQRCATCIHIVDNGAQHGCKLMPGREINVNGWCKVWTAKS